ncbi:LIM and SH3 domain protein Lasp isoform X2 [Anastrepha ludens]|uniref:LIM and SH3 domain protein Lasp isoform X2 n=1 Tax=Anastrepha ludens TaxID=28586 RepID=UPI0023AEAE9B|nr:LIM and SH3 domain protein Lasp isoform X2 [Anastrepha ludens]
MSTQASTCNGFFQEHANSALNQYFQQLNSSAAAAAIGGMSSSNNSDSSANEGSGGASVSSSSLEGNRSSVSSIDSSKSVNSSGSDRATVQWNSMQQQAQQQQQHHHHQQQQQQQQEQQQQHMHHGQQQHSSHQQQEQQVQQQQQQQQQHNHHQHQPQQQSHHQHQHHHQQHQQQQQQQHTHQQHQQQHTHAATHSQLSSLSQTLSQNLAAAAAASSGSANTNPHSIFGTGNFHYKTNNSWTIPTLSCYQRLYNDNQQHYHRQFVGSGSGGSGGSSGAGGGGNSVETQSLAQVVSSGTGGSAGGGNGLGSCNVGVNANAAAAATAASVQHVANAVAAAVMANEQHQNHLNSLKARFQAPGNAGRKSPFLGFICKTNGKSSSNNKEVICGDDKYKEEGDLWNVEAQTAFLGPNLWDKTLPYDADLKYADLDEFLSENNIPDGLPGTHLGHSSGLGHRSDSLGHAAGLGLGLGHITTKRERSPSPSDCISPETLNPPSPAESIFDLSGFSFASSGRDFDPRTRAFSDEELKPQPMIKKSRKQFVPDELKDDKYWARRRKNNIAAKRSRDARRQKENQIAMRARYLEKENATLHSEVEQLKQENLDLRARLSKFQDV